VKRAGWYLLAGTVAGFGGVLGLHSTQAAAPTVLGRLPHSEAGPLPAATAPASGRAATPAAVPTRPATGPARTVTGAVVPYGYGELSVRVTVRGGQIVAVSVPLLRVADPTSQQIAAQAFPTLRSEVLAVHSAQIDGVSGATYTSEAYSQSIQSALDKLHVK
jgi:hypothetical protein